MPRAPFELPRSILEALGEAAGTGGRSADALSRSLDGPLHTVFQASTTGALMAGVFDGEVDAATVLAIARADELGPVLHRAVETPGSVVAAVPIGHSDNHLLFAMVRGDPHPLKGREGKHLATCRQPSCHAR